jgi:hypothetical protein
MSTYYFESLKFSPLKSRHCQMLLSSESTHNAILYHWIKLLFSCSFFEEWQLHIHFIILLFLLTRPTFLQAVLHSEYFFYFISVLQLVFCSALFVKLNFPFTELFYLFLLSLFLILRYMSYFLVFFTSSKSPETLETSRCSSLWLVCYRRVDPVTSFQTVYEFGQHVLMPVHIL